MNTEKSQNRRELIDAKLYLLHDKLCRVFIIHLNDIVRAIVILTYPIQLVFGTVGLLVRPTAAQQRVALLVLNQKVNEMG